MSVDSLLINNIKESSDSCLTSSINQRLKRHKCHSDQVTALLDIEVVTGSHGLMEHFKLEITLFLEPLTVEFIDGHGEVLRLKVPVRVAVTLNLRSLEELTLLFILERRLHGDESVWPLVWTQWILDSHTVVYLEVESYRFSSLVLFYSFEDSLVSESVGVAVLLHEG